MNKKLALFASCIPVKGNQRSLICDLHRSDFRPIPNAMYEILTKHIGKTREEIKKNYDHQYDKIIDDYLSFLEEEEYVFFTENINAFPLLNLEWDYPGAISNAIIDLGAELNYPDIFSQLENLGCQYIQFRLFEEISIESFIFINSLFEGSRISSIEWIIKFNKEFGVEEKVKNLLMDFPRIRQLIIHSGDFTKIIGVQETVSEIAYTENKIDKKYHCGIVEMLYFNSNYSLFTESQHHNTCLNRKISIDTEGNIKNCPSMSQSFGNIKDTTLTEALAHPDFKKYWNVTKDQISICKDCEFRHICTDCRAYVENPEDMYSKPLKCGYNPYTCEWEEWSTNPLKEKAIQHYGMEELINKVN
ncbi:MAG: grasp-with-spasm system SPASM domain peptide maturase [Saprospiraceae bacterium]